MDDLFIQWAMDTLDQPAAGAAYSDDPGGSFPSLHALRSASQAAAGGGGIQERPGRGQRANSWSSSGDTGGGAAMEHDGWSPNKPVSWDFGAGTAQPNEVVERMAAAAAATAATRAPAAAHELRHAELAYGAAAAATRRGAAKSNANAAAAAAPVSPYAQDHIIAERRRREKINQRFIELSTVIPGLKKMDKATILGDAVRYVKDLQEKVRSLEDDTSGRKVESVVLVKKPCFSTASAASAAAPQTPAAAAAAADEGLPEIEARLSEKSMLVRIHCENARGAVVRVLSELERLHLGITHTNVMPFPASTVIITIAAKVEEGFSMTVEEIVRRLSAALHQQQEDVAVPRTATTN